MEINEKRAEKRVESQVPVSLVTKDNPGIIRGVLSFNISAIGICIKSDIKLALNEKVELEIPTSLGKLKVDAEIVWSRMDEYGCHFVDMDPMTHRTLKQWLFPPFEP